MRNILLVANPIAGRGRVNQRIGGIEDRFRRRGFTVHTVFTSEGEEWRANLNSTMPWQTVVAVGGDGTVNAVIHSLLQGDFSQDNSPLPTLGIIPFGTGNASIPAFGIPARWEEAVENILSGRTREVDVGLVKQGGLLKKVFLLWLGAGLDGVVMHTISETRSGPLGVGGLLIRIPGALWRVKRYPFHEIQVEVDGQASFSSRSVMVANVGHIALMGNVARKADASDGKLELIATTHTRFWSWLFMGIAITFHRLDGFRGVQHLQGKKIKLTSPGKVPVHIDGDAAGTLPMEIEVQSQAIRLIVP